MGNGTGKNKPSDKGVRVENQMIGDVVSSPPSSSSESPIQSLSPQKKNMLSQLREHKIEKDQSSELKGSLRNQKKDISSQDQNNNGGFETPKLKMSLIIKDKEMSRRRSREGEIREEQKQQDESPQMKVGQFLASENIPDTMTPQSKTKIEQYRDSLERINTRKLINEEPSKRNSMIEKQERVLNNDLQFSSAVKEEFKKKELSLLNPASINNDSMYGKKSENQNILKQNFANKMNGGQNKGSSMFKSMRGFKPAVSGADKEKNDENKEKGGSKRIMSRLKISKDGKVASSRRIIDESSKISIMDHKKQINHDENNANNNHLKTEENLQLQGEEKKDDKSSYVSSAYSGKSDRQKQLEQIGKLFDGVSPASPINTPISSSTPLFKNIIKTNKENQMSFNRQKKKKSTELIVDDLLKQTIFKNDAIIETNNSGNQNGTNDEVKINHTNVTSPLFDGVPLAQDFETADLQNKEDANEKGDQGQESSEKQQTFVGLGAGKSKLGKNAVSSFFSKLHKKAEEDKPKANFPVFKQVESEEITRQGSIKTKQQQSESNQVGWNSKMLHLQHQHSEGSPKSSVKSSDSSKAKSQVDLVQKTRLLDNSVTSIKNNDSKTKPKDQSQQSRKSSQQSISESEDSQDGQPFNSRKRKNLGDEDEEENKSSSNDDDDEENEDDDDQGPLLDGNGELNDSLLTTYDVGCIDGEEENNQIIGLVRDESGPQKQQKRRKHNRFYIGTGIYKKIKRVYIRSVESITAEPYFQSKKFKFEWVTGEIEKKNYFLSKLKTGFLRRPLDISQQNPSSVSSKDEIESPSSPARKLKKKNETIMSLDANNFHRTSDHEESDEYLNNKKEYIKNKSELQQFGVAICSRKGNKDEDLPNQDDYLFYKDQLSAIYAVLDGHGPFGHVVSNLAYRILFMKFLSSINCYVSPETALRSLFRTITVDIDSIIKSSKINCNQYLSGASCSFIVHRFNTLIISHVGDTKAFVFKKGVNVAKKDKLLAIQLTEDHIPSNIEERRRIYHSFGEVRRCADFSEKVFVRGRDYPGLHITRSIGDSIGTEVGITSDPQIKSYQIDTSDNFVILGTASLFELVPLEEIWSLVTPFSASGVTEASRTLQSRIKYLQMQQSQLLADITFVIFFL